MNEEDQERSLSEAELDNQIEAELHKTWILSQILNGRFRIREHKFLQPVRFQFQAKILNILHMEQEWSALDGAGVGGRGAN